MSTFTGAQLQRGLGLEIKKALNAQGFEGRGVAEVLEDPLARSFIYTAIIQWADQQVREGFARPPWDYLGAECWILNLGDVAFSPVTLHHGWTRPVNEMLIFAFEDATLADCWRLLNFEKEVLPSGADALGGGAVLGAAAKPFRLTRVQVEKLFAALEMQKYKPHLIAVTYDHLAGALLRGSPEIRAKIFTPPSLPPDTPAGKIPETMEDTACPTITPSPLEKTEPSSGMAIPVAPN